MPHPTARPFPSHALPPPGAAAPAVPADGRARLRWLRRPAAAFSLAALAGIALLLCGHREGRAQGEWTRFRGPNGTGASVVENIPTAFDESDFRWNVALPGTGHSSPVLWGEKIFLTCEVREKNERFVVCVDARDGSLLWSWKDVFTPYKEHVFNSFAASTPAVDADGVYVSWISGTTFIVTALDHSGRKRWSRSMGDFAARFGAGASPIVHDGTVIMANDHAGQESFLIGLDAKTGETRWKTPRTSGLASYITPTLYRGRGGRLQAIFVSPAHGVTGVDPATGEVLWEVGGLFHFRTVASPIVASGLVFAFSGKGGGGREAAVIRPPDGRSGGKPELAYELSSSLPYVPTPIARENYLFLWSDGGVVTCLEAATGQQLWRERVGGEYFSSPVRVADRLFCVSKKGQVVVIQAGPEYKLLARNQLPEGAYATPALANGCIYFRTFGRLLCLPGRAE